MWEAAGQAPFFSQDATWAVCTVKTMRSVKTGLGWEVDQQRLAQIMLELQQKGGFMPRFSNANSYLAQIAEVLQSIKPRLKIPVVYNCGGYERTETLSWLSGLVDIYLPDLKYKDSALAASYSGCADYFEVACAALQEMVVGR